MLLNKQKKSQNNKGNRILISITVMGSAGPIRFVVSEDELVCSVIDTALRAYAKEGRLPVLGSDVTEFLLYSPYAGHEVMNPLERIGLLGARNFMLCKKPASMKTVGSERFPIGVTRKGTGGWKSWLNKSLNLKISSH